MSTPASPAHLTAPPAASAPRRRRRTLPAGVPRTATQLLLARGGDPFDVARAAVASAWTSTTQLVEFIPAEQERLARQLGELGRLLERGADALRDWTLTPEEETACDGPVVPSWGEPTVSPGSAVGTQPVNPDPHSEPVYGFAATLERVRRELVEVSTAVSHHIRQRPSGLRRVYLAGALANAAAQAEHMVEMFAAAVWDYERPAMPVLPATSGRVELRSAPRAAPQTRWARYARLLFTEGRVEVTTAAGRRVFGIEEPIAYLLHVVPPSPVDVYAPYDEAERYVRTPGYDELGVVHLCTAAGTSLGAVAVADWVAQPGVLVAQPAAQGRDERLRAHDRLVHGVQASGIAAGAATLRVPVRRGVMHPPPARPLPPAAAQTFPGDQNRDRVATPIDLVRPAPHLLPYRGPATNPKYAFKRRLRRGKFFPKDTGPASHANILIRWPAVAAIIIGGLGSAYVLSDAWWVRLCVVLMFAAVAEPWLWWAGEWLLDRDKRRMAAVYRPGGRPLATRRFAHRAALLYDGANIGVRGASGHEAWLPSASDADLGVVGITRLTERGAAWGLALVDRRGTWRLVLSAEDWAPGGDLTGLAGFARAAGLSVGDAEAARLDLTDDVFDERSAAAAARSRGPRTRSMVQLGAYALAVLPLTLPGSRTATLMLLAVTVIAWVPALLRWVWAAWGDRAR